MRAFEYDAFISHNQADGAVALAAALETEGARVFCDEAVDLSDRRVRDRVAQGLARSGCVVLHAGNGFRDSRWCRAEYEMALAQTASGEGTRLAVAQRGQAAALPNALNQCKVFVLPSQTISLARFVVETNRVPRSTVRELQLQSSGKYGSPLGTEPLTEMSCKSLLRVVSELRSCHEDESPPPGADEVAVIISSGRRAVHASNADLRTNGHRALILVAAVAARNDLLEEIKSYLCREAHGGVLNEALWLYLHAALPIRGGRQWMMAALIRATEGVRTLEVAKKRLDRMPESLRRRVVLGGLNLGGLPLFERSLLLQRRLQVLAEGGSCEGLAPWEVEGSLRQLLPHLGDPQLRRQYRRLVSVVVDWSEGCDGLPIRQMGAHACDVLVEPLARSLGDSSSSLEEFEVTCRVVAEQIGKDGLLSRLRLMGRLVRGGASWIEAQRQADLAARGRSQPPLD